MLTDSEKERIRDEEAFRLEVRKLISPTEKKPAGAKRLWEFLNSPVALWFLSAVVLYAATNWVTKYFNDRKADAERVQSIRKLRTEVDYRIRRTDSYMRILSKDYTAPAQNADNRSDDLDVPGTQVNAFYKSLLSVDKEGTFKDLSEFNLRSLLWELERLETGDRKKEAEVAFNGAKALQDFIEKFEDESVRNGEVSANSLRSRTYFAEDLKRVQAIFADLKRVLI